MLQQQKEHFILKSNLHRYVVCLMQMIYHYFFNTEKLVSYLWLNYLNFFFADVLLTVHLSLILVFNQRNAQNFVL